MKFLIFSLLFIALLSPSIAFKDEDNNDDDYNYDYTLSNDTTTSEYYTDEVHYTSYGDDDEDNEDEGSGSGDEDYDIDEDDFEEDQLKCRDGSLVLTKDKMCDGVADCGDCSDELGCEATINQFFFCYDHEPVKGHVYHPTDDPYCIPRKDFCKSGYKNCKSKMDQRKSGFGPKCFIKHQHESCLLTDQLIVDNNVDCEDKSDENLLLSKSIKNGSVRLGDFEKDRMFKCLSDDDIYIFKNQVCDGTLDCPDFSDECLCTPVPDRTSKACLQLQARGTPRPSCHCGSVQAPNNCGQECKCGSGEVKVDSDDGSYQFCVESSKICESSFKSSEVDDLCKLTEQEKVSRNEHVKCIGMNVEEGHVRAVKCDGRPECLFGEDECDPECGRSSEKSFCDLFDKKTGYQSCRSGKNQVLCDGVEDCKGGIDEIGCASDTKTAETNTTVDPRSSGQALHCSYDQSVSYQPRGGCEVSQHRLWDGQKDCQDGTDECPVFLSQPDESHETLMRSAGISSHDSLIENPNIKNFVGVCGGIGLVTNLIALLMSLVRWRQHFLRHRNEPGSDESVMFALRLLYEGGFSLSLAASKLCLSAYLVVIAIKSSDGDSPYCSDDLRWRSSSECSTIGGVVMLAVPAGVYASFLMSMALFVTSNFNQVPMSIGKSLTNQILAAVAFNVVLWVPLGLVTILAPASMDCHAWVSFDGSMLRNHQNVLDRDAADGVLSCIGGWFAGRFSWQGFIEHIQQMAPGYHAKLHGTFDYFSHSATCLPMYLATAASDESCPFAGSLSVFVVAAVALLCVFALTLAIIVMRGRSQNLADMALGTACFAVVEAACWFPAACLFLIGITSSGGVVDRVYQSSTLVIICLNAGLFAPCLELFRFFCGHRFAALGGMGSTKSSSVHDDNSRMLDSPTKEVGAESNIL